MTPATSSQRSWLARGALVALVLFVFGHMAAALRDEPADAEHLWDFRLYYFAAEAAAEGLDPYQSRQISTIADRIVTLPYCYPAPTLSIWRPFNAPPYPVAVTVYLVISIAIAIGLMVFWARTLLKDETDWTFFPFCLLAYNCALVTGISTGNAILIEQALLWTAFFCFMRDRIALFAVLVLAAATFKVASLAFLVVLLMPPTRKRLTCLALALAAFGVFLFGCSLDSQAWTGWLTNVARLADERGSVNPALLPAARDAAVGVGLRSEVGTIVYAVLSLGICVLSWRAWRRIVAAHEGEERARRAVFLVCLLVAVVSPRFKDYACIQTIPATWFVLTMAIRAWGRDGLVWVALLVPLSAAVPALHGASPYLVDYSALWISLLAWALFCWQNSDAQTRGDPS